MLRYIHYMLCSPIDKNCQNRFWIDNDHSNKCCILCLIHHILSTQEISSHIVHILILFYTSSFHIFHKPHINVS